AATRAAVLLALGAGRLLDLRRLGIDAEVLARLLPLGELLDEALLVLARVGADDDLAPRDLVALGAVPARLRREVLQQLVPEALLLVAARPGRRAGLRRALPGVAAGHDVGLLARSRRQLFDRVARLRPRPRRPGRRTRRSREPFGLARLL